MLQAKKLFSLIAGLALCAPALWAQGVKWSVPPEFDSIEQISDKLYTGRNATGVGVFNAEGEMLVNPACASMVTPFTEGLAVVLKADNSTSFSTIIAGITGGQSAARYRLYGILSLDGSIIVPPGEYYLGDYPFFSEGMLPVYDINGKYGYMNSKGDVVVPCKFSTIHPFCQGYASVEFAGLIKRMAYIDKSGVELPLDKSLGKISYGTSFYNNEAMVCSAMGSYCIIDNNGHVKQSDLTPNLKVDWKFRISDEIQPVYTFASAISGPTPIQSNGKYGYIASDGRFIVPAQFSSAQPFRSGYAIASMSDNAVGLLKLLNESVVCGLDRGSTEIDEKGMECVAITVLLPQEYRSETISVHCYGEGHDFMSSLGGDGTVSRSAEFIVPSKTHIVEVKSGNLLLVSDSFDALGPDAKITVTAAVSQPRANDQDQHPFTVTFKNAGRQDVKLNVSISGGNAVFYASNTKKEYSKTSILVKAGSTYRLGGICKGVTKREKRTLTIKYGDESVNRTVSVVPVVD